MLQLNSSELFENSYSIRGKLKTVKDKINGFILIFYKDRTAIRARICNGVVNGKISIYDKWKKLQAVGIYKDGLPNGPFWIFTKTFIYFIRFNKGYLGK